MSYAKRRLKEKSSRKFRIVILLWEVEPRLNIYSKSSIVSSWKNIRTIRRFERDFDVLPKALSFYNLLTERLKEFWNRVTLQR